MLNLPSFINEKLICSTHQGQFASSYCIDCKVFCCLVEKCGHSHLYHSLENIDSFLSTTLIPAMTTLTEINQKRQYGSDSNNSSLQALTQSLTNSVINQKNFITGQYKSIQSSLDQLHLKCLKQFDDFLREQLNKFNLLQKKMDSCLITKEIIDINNNIMATVNNSMHFDMFIKQTAHNMSKYNKELKKMKESMKDIDLKKDIEEITTSADKEYDIIKQTEDASIESFVSLLQHQHITMDKLHSMKETKVVPKRITFTFHTKKAHSDIDLDLFVRELHTQFNIYRKDPSKLHSLLSSFVEATKSNDPKIGFIINYLKNLSMNYSLPLEQLEWDNDLSNCTEDYFKETGNKIVGDKAVFKEKIKTLLSGYFSNADYLNNVNTYFYQGVNDRTMVLVGMLLNEDNWDSQNKHCLFNEKFNIVGICAVPDANGKIQMIVNMGFFKINN